MSKAIAEYRAARAVELRMTGLSYEEIADELGFADRSGAWRAVIRCLRRRQLAAADTYLAGAFAATELVIEGASPMAAAGDLAASRIALRAIEDQVRLVEVLSTRESTEKPSPRAPKEPKPPNRSEPEAGHFGSMVF